MSEKEDTQYFYIKADPDHHDLEDIFNGKYIKNRQEWQFNKSQEKEVTEYLYCESAESESIESDEEDLDNLQISENVKELISMKRRQRDRLHRANSFNASDDSDEEHDSIDGSYRRARPSNKKISADVRKLKKEIEKMDKEETKKQ